MKIISLKQRKERKNLLYNMKIKRQIMNYHWRRFTQLVEISYHIDKNTDEYNKINKMCWECFDRWCSLYLNGYTEDENE